MEKITVVGLKKNSPLHRTEPYWGGPKGDAYIDQGQIDETQAKLARLHFPCCMADTGEKDLYGKRILVDEFGVSWSEGHFDINEAQRSN